MPRYERRETGEFWEIEKEGKSLTARWGRIGTEGPSATETFDEPYAAAGEYQKRIVGKLAEGFRIAHPSTPPEEAAPPASNPELERSLFDDLENDKAWLVYADWLQSKGDPRGELIALHAADHGTQAKAHAAKHADSLWGDAQWLTAPDPWAGRTWMPSWRDAKPMPFQLSASWKLSPHGLIDTLRLSGLDDEGEMALAAESLLSCPMGRFTRAIELEIGERHSGATGQPSYGVVAATIARARPGAVRRLSLATGGYQISWTETGDLGPLWPTMPRLTTLLIEIGRVELGAAIDLPRLDTLRIESGGLEASNLRAIAGAKWPSLRSLELFLGRRDYGGDATGEDVARLLAGGYPRLRKLAVCNSEIATDVLREVLRSKLLPQLEALDLSKGTLSDEDAPLLLESAKALAHIETLDLSESYFSPGTEDALTEAFGERVRLEGQRFEEMERDRAQYGADEWAKGHTFRYSVVGE